MTPTRRPRPHLSPSPCPRRTKSLPGGKTPYTKLPPPGLVAEDCLSPHPRCCRGGREQFAHLADGSPDPAWYSLLTTGGTGVSGSSIPDTRIPNANSSASRPVPADAAAFRTTTTPRAPCTASTRCGSSSIAARTRDARQPVGLHCATCSPGSKSTVGAGSNGMPQPATSTDLDDRRRARPRWASTTCCKGDVAVLQGARRQLAMSDNFHQAVRAAPAPTTSCSARATRSGSATATAPRRRPPAATRSRTRTRSPARTTGTPRRLRLLDATDGVGSGGGTYSDCADSTQPGVGRSLTTSSLRVPVEPELRRRATTTC